MFSYFQKQGLASSFLLIGNLLALLLLWAFTIWRFRLSPDFIPLHYTVYFGFDRFGPRSDIFLFASLGAFILLTNLLVAKLVFSGHNFWRNYLLAFTLFLEIVLLVSLVLVVIKTLL